MFRVASGSRQPSRSNRSAKFRQGAGRHVLRRGTNAIKRMADDVQIPSSFFTEMVWKSRTGLKSVGLVVDQWTLLDARRTPFGQPGNARVEIKHRRPAIETIEKRSVVSFGYGICYADTISQPCGFQVGERQVLIRAMSDLLA